MKLFLFLINSLESTSIRLTEDTTHAIITRKQRKWVLGIKRAVSHIMQGGMKHVAGYIQR
jgi:hypothetical protein